MDGLEEVSVWERNADHEYIQMTGVIPAMSGLTEPFCASLKLKAQDLLNPFYTDAVCEDLEKASDATLAGAVGIPLRTTMWIWNKGRGWIIVTDVSMKTDRGTIRGEAQMLTASSMYPMWYPHLDFENKRLYQPATDVYISSRDVQLMRMWLMGLERKEMADRLFVSVSAIEKRLGMFRKFPTPGGVPFGQGMAESGLSSFILGCPDWFGSSTYTYHETYAGPLTSIKN
jgi:hypothetical protein